MGNQPTGTVRADLELVQSFWGQVGENSALVFPFTGMGLTLVIELVDFDDAGEPNASGAVSNDGKTLSVQIHHAKGIAAGGFGTKHPISIGKLTGRAAFMSYLYERFGESINVSVALYLEKTHDGD